MALILLLGLTFIMEHSVSKFWGSAFKARKSLLASSFIARACGKKKKFRIVVRETMGVFEAFVNQDIRKI